MDVPTLELRIPNRLVHLERVGRELEGFAHVAGLPGRTTSAVTLAVDELITNIVMHGYSDSAEHEIVIRACRDGDQLEVEIEDDGRPFDPLTAPAPELDSPVEDRPIGGLGLHLVRKLIDAIAYRRIADRNHLTLRKRSSGDEEEVANPTAAQGLLLSESDDGGALRITLRGRLGMSPARLLEQMLRARIDTGTRRIVLDCRELAFIGSAGLRALMVAAKSMKRRGGVIELAALSDPVREMLEVSGLMALFEGSR